jgi:hypothetical protein
MTMRKYNLIIILAATCMMVSGQQIAEVIEYTPAPGQFINTASGSPEAALSLTTENGGLVSLGGFGGYIILRSSSAIENDPDNPYGVDFTIYGNAMSHWSEPGIVSVMKDENRNGVPDETWYELAGSDHFFPSTISNYEISYTNPLSEEAADIPWGDNQGANGLLLKNAFQTQPYYPDPSIFTRIGVSKCKFEGTHIEPVLDFSNPAQNVSYKRRFGYADNNNRIDPENPLPDDPYTPGSENSGGDGMDISWAIDSDEKYVELDEIDFIKIYTAANANGGILGELSTEISQLVDISPGSGYPIAEKIITVKELPSKIEPDSYELEYSVFFNGRYREDETAIWTVDCSDCMIDNNEILLIDEVEESISLTVTLNSDPTISTTFTTQVERGVAVNHFKERQIHVYPNPASDYLILEAQQSGTYQLISSHGQIIHAGYISQGEDRIDLSGFERGIYFLRFQSTHGLTTNKIMIQR